MTDKIAPSLMCADIFDLKNTIDVFNKTGIEYLHIDVMDGSFVPNFCLGTDYIRRLAERCKIPFDIHLMVDNPERTLDVIPIREDDYVSVHVESTKHINKALCAVRARGGKPMAAINPGTPLCMLDELYPFIDGVLVMGVNPGFAGQKLVPGTLEKITALRTLLDKNGFENTEIEIDGNANYENVPKMKRAGANIFVVGTSSIFNPAEDLEQGVYKMRRLIADATK